MESRYRRLSRLAAGLPLTLMTSTGAASQALASGPPAVQRAMTAPIRAAEMETKGWHLVQFRDSWLASAVLLEAAALLRPHADTRTITLLEVAGRTYHHTGEVERARLTLLTAARLAARLGQIRRAADAYLTAAEMAKSNGLTREAISAFVRAYELSLAPELDEGDRFSIWRRLGLSQDERPPTAEKSS
jgi:hypothetical protein